MTVIRLPSWGEVLRGPWAIRLRSGGSGVWLMRGEADSVPGLECRFLDSRAARTTSGALEELEGGLGRHGLTLEPRAGGRVLQGEVEVGTVTAWEADRVTIEWRPAS